MSSPSTSTAPSRSRMWPGGTPGCLGVGPRAGVIVRAAEPSHLTQQRASMWRKDLGGRGSGRGLGGPPQLLEDRRGHLERVVGGRHAGVDGRVLDDLGDLGVGEAVVHGGPHVQGELVPVPQGDGDREREQAAVPPGQAWALPEVTPGGAGDEVLEGGGERRGGRDRAVDVRIPEDLPAGTHSGCAALVVGARTGGLVHVVPPVSVAGSAGPGGRRGGGGGRRGRRRAWGPPPPGRGPPPAGGPPRPPRPPPPPPPARGR